MNATLKMLPIVVSALLLVSCSGINSTEQMQTQGWREIMRSEVTIQNQQFSPEALWALGRLGEYVVSPDGRCVAYTFTFYSMKENTGTTELYVYSLEDDKSEQRIFTGAQCYNLHWGDDNRLYFISTHEGSSQIFQLIPDGTGLRKVSSVTDGVDGFLVSPDSKHILYASTIQVVCGITNRHEDLPQATGLLYDDLMYRHWDRWDDGTRSHLFVASFDGTTMGEGVDILAGEPYDSPLKPFGGMEEIGWATDGMGFAYTCKKLTGKEAAFSTNSDLYYYDIATKTTRNMTENYPGYDRCPAFSPDGKYMAWLSMERAGFEADKDRLMIMDLASGEVYELTEQFDYSASSLVWTRDSKALYYVAGVRGTHQIYHHSLEEKLPRPVTAGLHDYHSVALAGDHLIGDKVSMTSPASLFLVNAVSGSEQELTHQNKELLDQIQMPQITERWITTTDGKEMLTWVILPPNFDSTHTYPALLYCEGGPQSSLTQFWSYRWNLALMASQGYVVVAPNRRGTLTFGQEWTDAISKDHGGQEMRDLLTAIDVVAKEPWIDSERLGAVGASYGGYTVNWLAGHHQGRFKAFISHCGVFHSEMEFYTTEELFFDEWEMGGKPWEKGNRVAQASFAQSPHHFVEKWDTPIMIIHGGHDFRIPYTQGMAAFNAAQMLGVESRFLFFPDESHWVLKPQNGLLWQREFYAWLEKYLK